MASEAAPFLSTLAAIESYDSNRLGCMWIRGFGSVLGGVVQAATTAASIPYPPLHKSLGYASLSPLVHIKGSYLLIYLRYPSYPHNEPQVSILTPNFPCDTPLSRQQRTAFSGTFTCLPQCRILSCRFQDASLKDHRTR